MKKPKIELRNVSKSKSGKVILSDISLKFQPGEKHIIFGPSGAGKTTLLRLLNRMDDPSSGEILFDGKRIREIPIVELRRRVGIVFQVPVVFPGTVKDNLLIPHKLGVLSKSPDQNVLAATLKLSGLDDGFLYHEADKLSVGEKQRLNVARALMNNPEVLLLDEPTSALDKPTALKLLESVKKLNETLEITIVMVTHQIEHAEFVGGKIIRLKEASLVSD